MNETWWRKADQLDGDQGAIVSLPLIGSHLIIGPPGSGKTNLLLLRASYLARSGQSNIAVISFSRMLKEFIASGTANYAFESERIRTFRSWGVAYLKSHGYSIDTNCEFEELRCRLLEGLRGLKSKISQDEKLDCILIDEAQDYNLDEIDIMRSFSRSIFAVGDDRQRIYEATGALSHLASFCKSAPPLKFHYRNGTAICRFVDGMSSNDEGLLDTSNYDESTYPSNVERLRKPTLAEQAAAAAEEISTQLLAYPDEWIGVFCYRKHTLRQVFDVLSGTSIAEKLHLQTYDDGYEAFDPSKPVILLTMHSAKGLEFRAVHMLAVEELTGRPHERNLAFTAATRAKTSLSIYHSKALPGYVENGVTAAKGEPVAPPTLEDLFGNAS